MPVLNDALQIVYYVFVGLLGACFGSFAGVIISRWPQGLSIITPRSFCHSCKKPLKPWHNLPILSWIVLRGKCAFCAHPYGMRNLVLEILFGLAFIAIYAKYGVSFIALEKLLLFYLVKIRIKLDRKSVV